MNPPETRAPTPREALLNKVEEKGEVGECMVVWGISTFSARIASMFTYYPHIIDPPSFKE